ncbi:hypothetical protein [Actinoallomurus bryophytorum]|uniref:hypothetical protein n=1 Tax=Actinoallomurus bryophytorum TaxID=1490222 RepID=UPI00114E9B2E|nr:hypothetical protein [Actinoallomurus bryophytorum]
MSAVVAGLIPGDTGFTPGGTGTHQTAARPRTANPQATVVDATWAPRAKKVLAQVNADLSEIDKAEAAAAAVPPEKRSARLRALLQRLDLRASDLTRLRNLLRSNLSLVANYGQAAESLADTQKQLGLLNQARGSLRSLSGPAREDMNWILNGLESQAGKLSQEERSHREAEENLRRPAVEASGQALPDLPDDVHALVREVKKEADESNPSRRHQDHPQSGSPWPDRPPSPPHSPPGNSNRTGAPPHPHSPSPTAKPSTPADHGKAPTRHEPSTPSKPAPPAPAHHEPAPQAPARPATPSGGGGQFSVDTGSGGGDSGSVASDASDSGVASDAGDSGDSGDAGGSDGGDGGGDGGDGGDGGGDGGGE